MPAASTITNWVCVYGDSHVTCFTTVGQEYRVTQGRVENAANLGPPEIDSEHWGFSARGFAPARIIEDLVLTGNDGRRLLNPLLERAFCGGNAFEGGDWLSPGTRRVGGVVGLCLGGNVSYRLMADKAWDEVDFVVPGREHIFFDKARRLLPFSLVREIFAEKMRLIREALELLKVQYPGHYALVSAPPPHRDNDYIKKAMITKRQRGPHDQFILPSFIRLKMWLAVRGELEDISKDVGVLFIPEPPDSSDADGFLCREYWGDGFHANIAYGERMKCHILRCSRRILGAVREDGNGGTCSFAYTGLTFE